MQHIFGLLAPTWRREKVKDEAAITVRQAARRVIAEERRHDDHDQVWKGFEVSVQVGVIAIMLLSFCRDSRGHKLSSTNVLRSPALRQIGCPIEPNEGRTSSWLSPYFLISGYSAKNPCFIRFLLYSLSAAVVPSFGLESMIRPPQPYSLQKLSGISPNICV